MKPTLLEQLDAPTWYVVSSQGRVILGVFGSALQHEAEACAERVERDTGIPAAIWIKRGAHPVVGGVL